MSDDFRGATEESKFKVNRQVAALSRANPNVSSAFLFLRRDATNRARYCHGKSSSSVRLSVTLCDHIRWNTLKITSRLISLGSSLSADPNISTSAVSNIPELYSPKENDSTNKRTKNYTNKSKNYTNKSTINFMSQF